LLSLEEKEKPSSAEFEPNFGTVESDVLKIGSSNELVFLDSGNDLIDASNSQNGNRIYGSSGDDTFILGTGDILSGGEGKDIFLNQAAGDNQVTGGLDTDQFWIAVAEIPETVLTITDFELDADVIGVAVAFIYLFLTFIASRVFSWLEKRLNPMRRSTKKAVAQVDSTPEQIAS
jgi:hypothetical protein